MLPTSTFDFVYKQEQTYGLSCHWGIKWQRCIEFYIYNQPYRWCFLITLSHFKYDLRDVVNV